MIPKFSIRVATEKDIPLVLRFIKALAEYEKLPHEVTATEDILRHNLFERKTAEVLLAFEGDEAVGFAVFFHNFSTFLGKPGIYLEDVFVRLEFRGRGYGKALMISVARLAKELGWHVTVADPRAAFATKNLWVTRYDPAERYPAGDQVNQHPGGGGLPAFVAKDRPIDGEDIVLWHTFGTTHVPRPEDWPVMPVATIGFQLKPVGFFTNNPALDVPPSVPHAGHC